MIRVALFICALCLVLNASRAQTPAPQSPKAPPKPPTIPMESITTLECEQWRAASRRGYKLNDEEQTRYSLCISDEPTNEKWWAPPLETYVPKEFLTPRNPLDEFLKPNRPEIQS
jgi:hypothetical protein